ncbi:hypothetical protein QR680_015765 [Steinernema hermaphroditum]|uniref:Uncharacterized protein n=1 Tax=Steinernema hermaphroditum TaxID=289476 RepID=A0AA39LLG1_9BILA|nr:hypothetical protein QR680_015765 [Steinernema hermaphroditum]
MEVFFFERTEYRSLYNCSVVDLHTVGVPNVPLGVAYMAVGVTLEMLYLPCMIVLSTPELRRNSCHKIMFVLGLLDMCTLAVNSIITGFLTAEGAVYCTYPVFIYVCGAVVLGLWCATCATSVMLGINRSIDLWFPEVMAALFKGNKTYIWCALPFFYGAWYTWATRPVTYSSYAYAWFFDPYYEMKSVSHDPAVYTNIYHSLHNTATVIAIFSLYIFLSVSVWWKCRKTHIRTQTVSTVQKQIIFQSCMICLFNLCAAFVYVYMQYFDTPTWLIVLGQSTWIGCHGGAVIVYLGFNKTIRREVLKLFRLKSDDHRVFNVHLTGAYPTTFACISVV